MSGRLREHWTFLREAPPGERFARYHALRQQQHRYRWQRPLLLAGGGGLITVGVILMPAPGPGSLIAAAGAAIVAGESHAFAGFLDRTELRLRGWFGRRR
ncbi:PGPGW domain-containing protein [Solimonas flava]|uniref:PGPGW domain-containing protein n=1 Tax=Solimonas flava TaxID=415849 RepID=UPI00041756D9|nr:PGPGW domain-containing protein [Solimonas flava]